MQNVFRLVNFLANEYQSNSGLREITLSIIAEVVFVLTGFGYDLFINFIHTVKSFCYYHKTEENKTQKAVASLGLTQMGNGKTMQMHPWNVQIH